MSKSFVSLVCAAIVLAAVSGATAPTADAENRPQTIVAIVESVSESAAEGCLFALEFTFVGSSAGSGLACARSFSDGEAPYDQSVEVTLTFRFPEGSIVADASLQEKFVGESRLIQRATGEIVGGTGAYAGASGLLVGGGTVFFSKTIEAHLVYVLRLAK